MASSSSSLEPGANPAGIGLRMRSVRLEVRVRVKVAFLDCENIKRVCVGIWARGRFWIRSGS